MTQAFRFHDLCTAGLPFHKDSTSSLTLRPQTYICVVFDVTWQSLNLCFKVKTLKDLFLQEYCNFPLLRPGKSKSIRYLLFWTICARHESSELVKRSHGCADTYTEKCESGGKCEYYCKYTVLGDSTAYTIRDVWNCPVKSKCSIFCRFVIDLISKCVS